MADQSFPLVSIIMPTHNAAKFISTAIESVLEQTYTNWELIIVDDASTDNTAEVVSQFEDERIRYMPVERIGSPSGVRNVGLKQVRGELIAFLDADDLYYPNTLENLSAPLLADPKLIAAHGFAYVIDEEGKPMRQHVVLHPYASPFDPLPSHLTVTWEKIVAGKISCLLPALIIRRSTLDTVGYFDESLCGPEDFQFYARLYLHNFDGVKSLPIYAYQYRVYTASLTKDPLRYKKVMESVIRVTDWVFNEAGFPPEMQRFKSYTYVESYRYLARERLINKQPELARNIALTCLKDKNVKLIDWFKLCVPIIIRSFLPPSLDEQIVNLRWDLRNGIHRFLQQFQQRNHHSMREECS